MWSKNNNLKLSISKINEVVVNYGANMDGVLHVDIFQQQRRLIDNYQMLNDREKYVFAHCVVAGLPFDKRLCDFFFFSFCKVTVRLYFILMQM